MKQRYTIYLSNNLYEDSNLNFDDISIIRIGIFSNNVPLLNKPFICINGSNIYHHITYYIVKSNITEKFNYIHIDAHMDFGDLEPNKEPEYFSFVQYIL